MFDITTIMETLATHRPVFYSEADFQHALAWEIHRSMPEAKIRPEYRPLRDRNMYTDIWVVDDGVPLAIELKYLPGNHHIEALGETFDLRAAAGDIERYDCIKDICRLETVAAETGARGMAIVLSSIRAFWTPATRPDVYDREFRMHEGRVLEGTMSWAPSAPPSSMRGREAPLTLRGRYPLKWSEYSSLAEGKVRFRYLCTQVRP